MKKYICSFVVILVLSACSGEVDVDGISISNDFIDVESALTMPSEGGTSSIEIKANCDWTISTETKWLSIGSARGTNSQTISISADRNRSESERVGALTVTSGQIAQKRITITQAKSDPSSLVPESGDNLPPQ